MEYLCRVFFALKLSAAIYKVTRVCLMNERLEKMVRQNEVMGVCVVSKKVDGRGTVKRISLYRFSKPFHLSFFLQPRDLGLFHCQVRPHKKEM